jgi:ElaB/YqjD/DUF883 family membrane-anchored ribosome-binding protein
MNETTQNDNTSKFPNPTGDHGLAGASTQPAGDKPGAAAVGLLKQVVQGAHTTIDRLADRAEPGVQQLGERASAAEDALREKADQLSGTRDEWLDGARTSIRDNPLVAVAAAVTLGLLIARVTR